MEQHLWWVKERQCLHFDPTARRVQTNPLQGPAKNGEMRDLLGAKHIIPMLFREGEKGCCVTVVLPMFS